ncbi:MAG: tetratricopeptide repeat protein [Planctomycetota bacterium]
MKHRCIAIILLALSAPFIRCADTPEDLLKEALAFEKANDSAKAAQAFSDFIKKFPEHTQAPDAHYRLGKALENLGSVDDAIKEYQAVTQSDKKYRGRQDAFYSLGKLYASIGQHDKAIDSFEKLLSEGAGLYEDEAQNLCSGWYAVKGKYDEAAAKLNILKRKKDSPFAEQASYKLAVLWLKAEKLDFSISAIEDLASNYPNNKHVPELLLQLADVYRKQQKFDKAISVAEQLKARYPKAPEALGGGYILGLCARDRKDFKKAIEVFESIGRVSEFRKRGLAAEALLQAAEIYFTDLAQPEKAVERYAEAAMSARDSDSERKNELLEQCYFHIAEHYFVQKKWSIALENYMLLRGTGTKLNITGRILACQAALNEKGSSAQTWSAEDIEAIRKKVADNPGTEIAAEGDVFLADRKFKDAQQNKKGSYSGAIEDYRAILKKYNKEILSKNSLESYVHVQLGACISQGGTRADAAEAVKEYEAAIAADPATPYKLNALECIASYAELAGDKKKSYETYQKLYELSGQPPAPGNEGSKNADTGGRKIDYLKAMVTRADGEELTLRTLASLKKIIEEKGQLSDEAREARFYMGELFFVKRDFSAAAKAYKEFVQIYGPKQDANGDLENGPWKPNVDSKVRQVYEAAARIAHSWYVQGHEQNMIAAYKWIVKNFPHNNKFMAEAQYWLSMELLKGKAGETKEGKRAAAEALWKNVVHPQLPSPVSEKNYKNQYHKWTEANDPDFDDVKKYVRTAMLKAGQYFGESGDHAMAANCFSAFVDRYPIDHGKHIRQRKKNDPRPQQNDESVDEQYQIARYALGREYVALGEVSKLIDTYKPYIGSMRDDKFRTSALKLLGFHAGKAGQYEEAIDAYATLLDEYGTEIMNDKGQAIPLPQRDRLRTKNWNWDGFRVPPPKDLDLGEIRFSLGYLYWKQEQWDKAAQALAPFAQSSDLRENKSRDRALFMAAQSSFKSSDYQNGLRSLAPLLKDYPKFDAYEEASALAARGYAETKNWNELELAYKTFRTDFPKSDRRPRMDFYAALAQIGQGKMSEGVSAMKALAGSETFEDVRADASYQIALFYLNQKPENTQLAFENLVKSVTYLPTDNARVTLGKCAAKLEKWEEARDALNKAIREFPKSARRGEAEALLVDIQKKLAKKK